MNPAQFLEKVQALPPDKQSEVFDFIEFLTSRSTPLSDHKSVEEDWTNAEFSKMSMIQAMRGMEEEPVLYTLDDLKEHWQ